MGNRLKDKVALVTAAGQGIGKATAIAFHNEGAKVIATDINDKTLEELKKEFPKIEVKNLDSTDNNEIKDYKSWKLVTKKKLDQSRIEDLEFANRIVKHSKSNAIVLVKDKQMLSSGVGQTSRVDALKFAIEKAKTFNFDLEGSVMASDAFFPFPDCIEIASEAGIEGVLQPGGSIKDNLSIESCNKRGMSMYLTGTRHFYH